jgi:hypothetical protein
MFTEDPELGPIDTPNARLIFLQVVGIALDELAAARSARISHDRSLFVRGTERALVLHPGPQVGWTERDGDLELTLTPSAAANLVAVIKPRRGVYPVPGVAGLVVSVVPNIIKDTHGNVVDTVG